MAQRGEQQHRGRQPQDVSHVLEEQLNTARSADGWSMALSAVPILDATDVPAIVGINLAYPTDFE